MLINQADENRDSLISFEEFRKWANKVCCHCIDFQFLVRTAQNMTPGLVSWVFEFQPKELEPNTADFRTTARLRLFYFLTAVVWAVSFRIAPNRRCGQWPKHLARPMQFGGRNHTLY